MGSEFVDRIIGDRYPLLSHKEQQTLGNETRQAREQLVLSNRHFALTIARKYTGHGVDMDDLYSEGLIGLHDASEKFDPKRGIFSVIASFHIRSRIRRYISKVGAGMARPSHLSDAVWKCRQIGDQLQGSLGREATDDEISEEWGKPVAFVAKCRAGFPTVVSLEQSVLDDEEGGLHNCIADETSEDPTECAAESDNKDAIRWALSKLPRFQALIIRDRFGIGKAEGKTMEQIGEENGLTRERIRQIETEALHTLRDLVERYDPGLTGAPVRHTCPKCGRAIISGEGCGPCRRDERAAKRSESCRVPVRRSRQAVAA
jgi:RNA polymerase primary sigma factor